MVTEGYKMQAQHEQSNREIERNYMRDLACVLGIDMPQQLLEYDAFMELARSKVKRLQTKIEMLMSQREPYKPVSSYEITTENLNQATQIRGVTQAGHRPLSPSQNTALYQPFNDAMIEKNRTPVKSPFALVSQATAPQEKGSTFQLKSLASEKLRDNSK